MTYAMQTNLAERQRLTGQLDKSLQLQQWKSDIFRAGGIKFKITSMGIQPRMTHADFCIKCIAKETGEVIGEWKGNEVPEHIFALMAPKSVQDMLTRPT